MCLVELLPCGSVLTLAISCTKFKIHSVHADSPIAKRVSLSFFREDQSLLHRPKNSGRECAWWTNLLVGRFFHQLSLLQSSRSIQRMYDSPMARIGFLSFFFLARTSLCFTDKETQEENVLAGTTPLELLPCGSVLTPAISCTKFKIHSVHADSPIAKRVFLSFCREDQSLLHRPRNSGRECAWWTSSFVGQYLHRLSLVQSSRSIQRMQTVPLPKEFLCLFLGRTSLCFTDQKFRKRMCLVDQPPCGSVLTPAISSTKFKIHSAHVWQSHGQNRLFVFFFFLARTSLCFTDKETQEENVLAGTTPLWVSAYTGYLLYKVQDPFSACRQSHCQKSFFVFL